MNHPKISLIGNGNVGKTAFMKKLLTGIYDPNSPPTIGVEVHPIDNNNNYINFWDCGGLSQYRGLGNGYYILSDAAIIMFDVTNFESFNDLQNWVNSFHQVCPGKPIIYLANKTDVPEEEWQVTNDLWPANTIPISVKNNFNLEAAINLVITSI